MSGHHHFHDLCKTLLQCLDLEPDPLNERVVEFVDIAYDEVSPKHYKEEEVGTENVVLILTGILVGKTECGQSGTGTGVSSPSEYIGFHQSVSFHQCCVLTVISLPLSLYRLSN